MLHTKGWIWEKYELQGITCKKFWLGTDLNGCRWLAKLKGSFYGYREIVFAKLAQRMGWCCQTSTFAQLDNESLRILGVDHSCRTQAVHYFLDQHKRSSCSPNCPYVFIKDPQEAKRLIKPDYGQEILNILRAGYSSILFGAGEPSEIFLTASDEVVIIDNEQMFATPISWGPFRTEWENDQDNDTAATLKAIKRDICGDIAALTDKDISNSIRIPDEVSVREQWQLNDSIQAAHEYARSFLRARV